MKTSKFNYIIKKPNTDSIVYNTLNNSFVSLLNEGLECLTTGKFDLLPQEVVGSLYDNGFLIDETMDETEFLKYQFDRTRYATETFAVTIAPTLNCNFACEYCYESPRPGVLDDAGFGLIMDFIRSAYDRAPFKRLQVNWYGGEPMLCIQSIARWSKGLLRFSESHAVKYVSHIITNGSLVTEKNVALLEGSKISNAQVTIDGWGDMHDKRRPSRDGKPKFDLILSAVELMAKHGIEVSIRVNADISKFLIIRNLLTTFKELKMCMYTLVTCVITRRFLLTSLDALIARGFRKRNTRSLRNRATQSKIWTIFSLRDECSVVRARRTAM